jgi:hypothetical protein
LASMGHRREWSGHCPGGITRASRGRRQAAEPTTRRRGRRRIRPGRPARRQPLGQTSRGPSQDGRAG